MIRPDDETKSFQSRWNTLARILLVESSVKLVARTAMDFADWEDGAGVFTGNVRMALATGFTDKTIRTAWASLRVLGMAKRVERASSSKLKSDRYNLAIPKEWESWAVLGPKEAKFHCVHCHKAFIPPPAFVLADSERPRWYVNRACFCPPPRQRKDRPRPLACVTEWEREHDTAWKSLANSDVWSLFREARGDDW